MICLGSVRSFTELNIANVTGLDGDYLNDSSTLGIDQSYHFGIELAVSALHWVVIFSLS